MFMLAWSNAPGKRCPQKKSAESANQGMMILLPDCGIAE